MKKHSGFRGGAVGATSAALLLAGISVAHATPAFNQVATIAVPGDAFNKNTGGTLTSFDISTYDPTTRLFYLGDRSKAGIDVFNLNNNTFVGTVGAGQFVGFTGSNSTSGADGTAVFTTPGGTRLVLGGDGNSTVKAYVIPAVGPTDIKNYSGTPAYTVNTVLPGGVANAGPSTPATTPVGNRADEMSYNPKGNNVLVANNAGSPSPYITLFNASTGAVIAQTVFDGTHGTPNAVGNSIEASIYDPKNDVYWLAIPQIGASATDPGGLSEVNASTGAVIATFPFTGFSSCNPTGVAISNSGQVAIGCANKGSQTLLFNTTTHAFKSVPFSGTDAVVFEPTINAFLLSGANYSPDGTTTGPTVPSFGIIDDATGTLSQAVGLTGGNPHSIDGGLIPGTKVVEIGVPEGANPGCATGCLQVFSDARAIPEPGSLPMLAFGLVALAGYAVRRRLN